MVIFRTHEMPPVNCEINLMLTWSAIVPFAKKIRGTTFAITDTKLYAPEVTLSTQENTKLLEQLKSGFKRLINSNKFQYLDYCT